MSEILVIIRPSFMKFCKDGCRAALFNHILYWIAKKAKGQPQDKIQAGEITYYATTEELTEQMAGAWGYQKVRREVNDLIDMGLVGRGKNPTWGVDRTKHFFFGKEQHEKLIELCQKYEINLSKIGLPSEVTELIKQFTNQSNANDQSVNCPEHKQFTDQSAAIYQSVGTITKDSTKDSKTKNSERKNDASEKTATVSAQEGSFSHPSSSLSSSLSGEETKTELSPEVKQTYDLICQELYPNCHPNLTTKNVEHFTKLATDIKTVDDVRGLVAYCRQEQPVLKTSKIHPANLVYWLDGWQQVQRLATQAEQNIQPDEVVVTDDELADDMWKIVNAYQCEGEFEKHLKRIEKIRSSYRVSNYDLCDKIVNACRRAKPENSSIGDFFDKLENSFY